MMPMRWSVSFVLALRECRHHLLRNKRALERKLPNMSGKSSGAANHTPWVSATASKIIQPKQLSKSFQRMSCLYQAMDVTGQPCLGPFTKCCVTIYGITFSSRRVALDLLQMLADGSTHV